MKDKIRIASGQGFWGDLIEAPYNQVVKGDIDYLVMDYLAEVTMSILQKQKNKNPMLGYAKDIPELMKRILPICKEKGIKIITNGGGVNPIACADWVRQFGFPGERFARFDLKGHIPRLDADGGGQRMTDIVAFDLGVVVPVEQFPRRVLAGVVTDPG